MRRVSSRFRWTIWSRSELLEFSVRLMGDASWPFDEPPDVAAFTVRQVIEGGEPILLVSHDEPDGAWQFISGRRPAEGDARIVAPREIWRRDRRSAISSIFLLAGSRGDKIPASLGSGADAPRSHDGVTR